MTYTDCDICYETKKYFRSCDTCVNKTCYECYQKVDKCPFCRTLHSKLSTLPDLPLNQVLICSSNQHSFPDGLPDLH